MNGGPLRVGTDDTLNFNLSLVSFAFEWNHNCCTDYMIKIIQCLYLANAGDIKTFIPIGNITLEAAIQILIKSF